MSRGAGEDRQRRRLGPVPLLLVLLTGACHHYVDTIEPPEVSASAAPTGTTPHHQALLYYIRCRLAWLEGDLEEALRAIDVALLFDPDSPHLHLVRYRLQNAKGTEEEALESLRRARERGPDDPAVLLEHGGRLLEEGRLSEACSAFARARSLGGGEEAWQAEIRCRIRMGDAEAAERLLDRWAKQAPHDPAALWFRGRTRLSLDDACGGQRDLGEVLSATGADGRTLDLYLAATHRCGRYRSALDLLRALARTHPGHAGVHQRLAAFSAELGDPFLAARAWEAVARLEGLEDATLGLMWAEALLAARRPDEALAVLKRTPLDHAPPAEVRMLRARALLARGDTETALALYREPDTAPTSPEEARLLAELWRASDRPERAMAVLEEAIARWEGASGPAWDQVHLEATLGRQERALERLESLHLQPAPHHLAQARILDRCAGRDEARRWLAEGTRLYPDEPLLWLARAHDLLETQEVQAALDVLMEARRHLPRDVDVLRLLSWARTQAGETDRARELLELAYAIDPEDPVTRNDLAWWLVEAGQDLPRAEKLARAAVERHPTRPAFLDTLGWVLYRRGRVTEAIRELASASRLAPEDAVLREHLETACGALEASRGPAVQLCPEPDAPPPRETP